MIELAIATRTAPDDWYEADDATVATALEILNERARAARARH